MASAISGIQKYPLPCYQPCIGIVCNGELEPSLTLTERIKSCGTIIGVDGGINHCASIKITPSWLVGDFDSVDPKILKAMQDGADSSKLDRAKDITDLEAGLARARAISEHSQSIIFAGLGGRIDHTMGNIYLLTRTPGKAQIESEHQLLFSIGAASGEIEITKSDYQTLALCDLTGSARNITLRTEEGSVIYPSLKQGALITVFLNHTYHITVGEGELLVCLDKRVVRPLQKLAKGDLRVDFRIQQPMITILQYLAHQALHSSRVRLITQEETLFVIKPETGKMHFPSQIGQTVSLIPLYGPVDGITTTGLKWDLGGASINRLDKNFVGISNVSMAPIFSIQIGQGTLLCVINRKLIDKEMVAAKIHKKHSNISLKSKL